MTLAAIRTTRQQGAAAKQLWHVVAISASSSWLNCIDFHKTIELVTKPWGLVSTNMQTSAVSIATHRPLSTATRVSEVFKARRTAPVARAAAQVGAFGRQPLQPSCKKLQKPNRVV